MTVYGSAGTLGWEEEKGLPESAGCGARTRQPDSLGQTKVDDLARVEEHAVSEYVVS